MSEVRAPYLTLVARGMEKGAVETVEAVEAGEAGEHVAADGVAPVSASEAMGGCIMQACLSWIALMREESAAIARVDVTPLGSGIYEAVCVRGHDGAEVLLRVSLVVDPGFVLRTVVEPLRPR